MKGSSYKMGGVKTKQTMAYMKSPLEQSKPDYIDIDKDGNTTESMKEASMAKMKSPLEQSWWDTAKEYGGKALDIGKKAVKKTIDKDLKMKRDLLDEAGQIGAGTGAWFKELFRDQGGGYGRQKHMLTDAKEAYSTQELEDALAKGDFSNVDEEDMRRAKAYLHGEGKYEEYDKLLKAKEKNRRSKMSTAELAADDKEKEIEAARREKERLANEW